MTVSKTSLVLATLFISAFAIAEQGAIVADEKDVFSALDLDKSGTISLEEAKAHKQLDAAFAILDTNDDKQLTVEEFANLKTEV